jgi:hypothetical protein
MSLGNLFLQQQMGETQRRIEAKQADEQKRRERAGLFSSFGGGIGGLLGGLAAGALTAGTGGLAGAALLGLGATGGSLLGARAGLELGDGRRGDAVGLGKNVDMLTGKTKEFSQTIKDRYRRDIDDFQRSLNTNILGQAVNTGLKAGAFAFANPAIQKGLGKARNFVSGNQLPTPATANIAGAQAYQPAGMGSDTLIGPARAMQAPMQGPSVPNNLLNMTSTPAPSMAGMGPLSNQAFDAASAVSNPLLPESVTNILGQSTNYAPTVNPQAYGNAMSRANYMRSLGLNLPSSLGGAG